MLFLAAHAISNVALCHVSQGPAGIAGLPVSTTRESEWLLFCLNAAASLAVAPSLYVHALELQ